MTFKGDVLSSQEKRASFLLASIFGIRMLGLFMILPVFSLQASHFQEASPFLIGLALGMYGFSSGICQIFFGLLSDIWGRKLVISLALLIFALGSFLAGEASSINMLIAGRFLQGLGASGSSILALLSDLTRAESRTKCMALLGAMIGLSFVISMILGPILYGLIGLKGLFFLTAMLALFGIVILWTSVPNPKISVFHQDQQFSFSTFKAAMSEGNVWRLNAGVFFLHAILIGIFVAFPPLLWDNLKLTNFSLSFLYLAALIPAFLTMIPLILLAERKAKVKGFSIFSIILLGLSTFLFLLGIQSMILMWIAFWMFFTGFIFLEAALPSWLSKICPLKARGTCFGFYSSFQFFGAFFGGAISGIFLANHSSKAVFILVILLCLFWLLIKVTIAPPPRQVTRMLSIPFLNPENESQISSALKKIPGVVDVEMGGLDKTAYVRVEQSWEHLFNSASEEALQPCQKEP